MLTIANRSPHTIGPRWYRLNTDAPLLNSMSNGAYKLRRGRDTGTKSAAYDLWLPGLSPFGETILDPDLFTFDPWIANTPLPDLSRHGLLTVNGLVTTNCGIWQDGAAVRLLERVRVGQMMVVEFFLRWYAETPWMAEGTKRITCSNPSIANLGENAPEIRAQWGEHGIIAEFGKSIGSPLAPAQWWADGQGVTTPIVIVWIDQVPPERVGECFAFYLRQIRTSGREVLLPEGNPRLPVGFDAAWWTTQNGAESIRKLQTMEIGVLGINANSADSGEQEDQCWHGECQASLEAAEVNYLNALKWHHQPNDHREWDGSPIVAKRHPNCMISHGRAHLAAPDRLGKVEELLPTASYGWLGPDSQHWLAFRLIEAYAHSGDDALQAEIEKLAQLYLLSEGLPSQHPGWGYIGFDSARSAGWKSWFAARCNVYLENTVTRQAIRDRWIARWNEVYLPMTTAHAHGWWDPRSDLGPPRLGTWVIGWQHAVGAWGMYEAGETFGVPAAKEAAYRQAKLVYEQAWVHTDGTWLSWPEMPIDGQEKPAPHAGFNFYGMCLAPALMIRHGDEATRPLWEWLKANGTQKHQLAFMPPNVP